MLLQDVGPKEVVIRHGNHWKRRKYWLNISSTGSIVKGREDRRASGKRWGAERRTGRLEMFEILWTGVYMYTIITCGFLQWCLLALCQDGNQPLLFCMWMEHEMKKANWMPSEIFTLGLFLHLILYLSVSLFLTHKQKSIKISLWL